MIGILCVCLSAFASIVILSPFLYAYASIVGLDGNPGMIDNDWGLDELQYLLGDVFCHQEMSRSFVINGNQMPFCIRDTGIFIGASVGTFGLFLFDREHGKRMMIGIGILLILMTVIEWASESFVGDVPTLRFLSGICAGIGVAMIAVSYIDTLYEQK